MAAAAASAAAAAAGSGPSHHGHGDPGRPPTALWQALQLRPYFLGAEAFIRPQSALRPCLDGEHI